MRVWMANAGVDGKCECAQKLLCTVMAGPSRVRSTYGRHGTPQRRKGPATLAEPSSSKRDVIDASIYTVELLDPRVGQKRR